MLIHECSGSHPVAEQPQDPPATNTYKPCLQVPLCLTPDRQAPSRRRAKEMAAKSCPKSASLRTCQAKEEAAGFGDVSDSLSPESEDESDQPLMKETQRFSIRTVPAKPA
ncbi:hypothetical protein JAAARDRAFT_198406 [Jaapia argillacea MUCL 33604]|uniref:Uncharacterized protein n=1 Tax=Jaapia argillacea MUCL 33604 TaxID=933084 RepID=A0A067PBC6_9AGAM|nr:hypothetical protein JAAARDRAFT_198406 [Jaapia argillacea MUCL 33604]